MSYWDSFKQVLKTSYCTVGGFTEWYLGQVSSLTDGTQLEGVANFQQNYARFLQTKFCGKNPDSSLPSALDVPFSGGQCQGAFYGLTVTVAYNDNNTLPHIIFNSSYPAIGAISSVTGSFENGNYTIRATHSGGVEIQAVRPVGGTITNIEVYRVDGGQDNCGNPPAGSIQPTNQPFTHQQDIEYLDENGVTATAFGVDFTYDLPYIDADGNVSVPYEVCWQGICFSGELEFGDEIKLKDGFNFGAQGSANTIPALIESLSGKVDSISEKAQLDKEELLEKIDKIEVFASVPEAYQIRTESGRKQLIIMYAEKFKDSKGKMQYSRNRLAQTIPHWNGSKNWKNLPIWTRGNYWAKAILADNSKIYVLADNEVSAKSVCSRLLSFVSVGMKSGAIITSGSLSGANISAKKAYPKYARFFPSGQKTKKDDVIRYEINL